MTQSSPVVVAVAGAIAFFAAWVGLTAATGERWQEVVPVALVGAVVFAVVNYALRVWVARRNR